MGHSARVYRLIVWGVLGSFKGLCKGSIRFVFGCNEGSVGRLLVYRVESYPSVCLSFRLSLPASACNDVRTNNSIF